MLHVKKMKKVRIAAPKSRMKSAIETLYKLQMIHLTPEEVESGFEIGSPFPDSEIIASKLLKLRSMKDFLKIESDKIATKPPANAEVTLEKVVNEFNLLVKKKNTFSDLEKELNAELENPLTALEIPASLFTDSKHFTYFKGTVKGDINAAASNDLKRFELVAGSPNKQKIVPFALFVDSRENKKARNMLSDLAYTEISSLPMLSIADAQKKLTAAEQNREKVEQQIEAFKGKYSTFIAEYENFLSHQANQCEAPLQFFTSLNAFIVKGWVPEKELQLFKEEINKAAAEKVVIEEFEGQEGAPVALQNPKVSQPFQYLLDLYSLPKYTELDPTFLMFITFPFFFGFMLGDVGYGIITLALFIGLRKVFKSSDARRLLAVAIMASLATIVFGFVYGEAFGVEFLHHPIIDRVHDTSFMLMLTIFIGFIHVNFGLALGFYNKLKQHGIKHAIMEKGSWYILELGAVFLALPAIGITMFGEIGNILGGILLLAAVGMLFKAEGLKGILEIPSLLSNTLSYARLFAVGLASVSLALIVNEMAGEMIAEGGIMIVAAIVLLLLGHAINLALGIIGPFIHSLRLHYVEFFTKFYEGGGKRYSPFGGN